MNQDRVVNCAIKIFNSRNLHGGVPIVIYVVSQKDIEYRTYNFGKKKTRDVLHKVLLLSKLETKFQLFINSKFCRDIKQ